jgi:hypothetical protein
MNVMNNDKISSQNLANVTPSNVTMKLMIIPDFFVMKRHLYIMCQDIFICIMVLVPKLRV